MRFLSTRAVTLLLLLTLPELWGLPVFAQPWDETNAPDSLSLGNSAGDATSATISKHVNEVSLVFTVTDSKRRFVSGLPASAFRLLDNHQPPKAVRYFQQQSELPLRVALLIDLSDSVRGRFEFEQQAAGLFLKRIMRPEVDRALVVGFDSAVHLVQDMTGDVDVLAKAIHGLKPGGDTALYDAIVFACNQLQDDASKQVMRRVIILISDGRDTAGQAVFRDAEQALARTGVVMYALSSNSLLVEARPKGDQIMTRLAGPTGGYILPAREKGDLKHAFSQIEKALRSQYVLGYSPPDFIMDGSYHSVEIIPRKPGLTVQSRKGYFAAPLQKEP